MPSGMAIAAKHRRNVSATMPAEAAAPFDGVADAVEPAKQDECRDAGAERHQDRERVRERRRVGKEPVHPREIPPAAR